MFFFGVVLLLVGLVSYLLKISTYFDQIQMFFSSSSPAAADGSSQAGLSRRRSLLPEKNNEEPNRLGAWGLVVGGWGVLLISPNNGA